MGQLKFNFNFDHSEGDLFKACGFNEEQAKRCKALYRELMIDPGIKTYTQILEKIISSDITPEEMLAVAARL